MTGFWAKSLPRVAFSLLSACLGAVIFPPAGRAQSPHSIEAIQRAWQQRQDRVKSAKLTWATKALRPKGSILRIPPGPTPTPPADTWVDRVSTLTLDGEKIRYTWKGLAWSDEKNAFIPDAYTSVMDGRLAKSFHPNRGDGSQKDQGDVGPATGYLDHRFTSILVLNATFRGMHPNFRKYDLSRATLGAGSVTINGSPCIEVRLPDEARGTVSLAYLDPAKDFVVLRSLYLTNGSVTSRQDVKYVADPVVGWRPSEWEEVHVVAGTKASATSRCRVTFCDLNPGVPADDFDIRFPAGARVYDHSQKRFFNATGEPAQFPVEPTAFRPLAEASRSNWASIAAFLTAVLALVALAVRRRRRARLSLAV